MKVEITFNILPLKRSSRTLFSFECFFASLPFFVRSYVCTSFTHLIICEWFFHSQFTFIPNVVHGDLPLAEYILPRRFVLWHWQMAVDVRFFFFFVRLFQWENVDNGCDDNNSLNFNPRNDVQSSSSKRIFIWVFVWAVLCVLSRHWTSIAGFIQVLFIV